MSRTALPVVMFLVAIAVLFTVMSIAKADTIIVDDDWNGADHSTIQAAVNAASDGDVIRVYAGTYNEDINVHKQLDFVGNGTSQTIIDGDRKDHVFGLNLLRGGCNVSGFQFYDWWPTHHYGGIGVYSEDNRIFDNLFIDNLRGIHLENDHNHIFNNTFDDNYHGLVVYNGADDCNISFNLFTRNYMGGILYGRSSGYTIFSNTFLNHSRSSLGMHNSQNVTVSFNMFDAGTKTSNTGAVILTQNRDTFIHNNTFVGFNSTIYVGYSKDTSILNNRITGNNKGIIISGMSLYRWTANDTEVHFNAFFGNTEGINASRNFGVDTDASYNWWGDPSGPYHYQNNTAGLGDVVTDDVDFDPWLDKMVDLPPFAFIMDIRPSVANQGDPVEFIGRGLARNLTTLHVWRSSIDGELYNGTGLGFTRSDLSNGTHTIYLKVRDEYGKWSHDVQLTLVVNGRPRSTIVDVSPTSPNEGDEVSFEGRYEDFEDDIQEISWGSDIDGLLSNVTVFNTTALTNGTHIISFQVRDGYGVWSEEATSIVVVNGLPRAYLDAIEPGLVNETESVIFRGSYLDHEDDIAGIVWTSDIDGVLSDQMLFHTSSLSNGTHTITFRVMDGRGMWSENATGTVTVNGLPHAFINDIQPNPLTKGEVATFLGMYIDHEDDIVAFEWTSSIDGPLSFRKDFGTSELSIGTHFITFRVRDRLLIWSEPASTRLFVNGRPQAQIITVDPDHIDQGDEVHFVGAFTDPENDVREYVWVSNIDGDLSYVLEFNISSLSNGTHNITFRVRDGFDVWSQNASTTVTVNGLPQASIVEIDPSFANEGDAIGFIGAFIDFEGDIVEYSWGSSIDGHLSSALEFSTTSLSNGTHGIEFRVLDGNGVWSETAIGTVTVNGLPRAFISKIGPDPAFEGDEVFLMGEVHDDGHISALNWYSDIDGLIGEGGVVHLSNLSVGNHTITLRAVDDVGYWSHDARGTLLIKAHIPAMETTHLWFPGTTRETQVVPIVAQVMNIGLVAVVDFELRFTVGGVSAGSVIVSEPLTSWSNISITIEWTAVQGNHSVSVDIVHEGTVLHSHRSDTLLIVEPTPAEPPLQTSGKEGSDWTLLLLIAIVVGVVAVFIIWMRME